MNPQGILVLHRLLYSRLWHCSFMLVGLIFLFLFCFVLFGVTRLFFSEYNNALFACKLTCCPHQALRQRFQKRGMNKRTRGSFRGEAFGARLAKRFSSERSAAVSFHAPQECENMQKRKQHHSLQQSQESYFIAIVVVLGCTCFPRTTTWLQEIPLICS